MYLDISNRKASENVYSENQHRYGAELPTPRKSHHKWVDAAVLRAQLNQSKAGVHEVSKEDVTFAFPFTNVNTSHRIGKEANRETLHPKDPKLLNSPRLKLDFLRSGCRGTESQSSVEELLFRESEKNKESDKKVFSFLGSPILRPLTDSRVLDIISAYQVVA